MRKLIPWILIVAAFLPSSCASSSSGNTTKVVKPRYHHRWFDRKNDKRVKRTRVVKVKS